ncbi:retrovirus-related pol polyprotein from transposon TNT 1-94 [Tanacetum coccineum]
MHADVVSAPVFLVNNNKCLVHDNLEIEQLEHENDHLFELLLSQDIVYICVNSLAARTNCREMQQSFTAEYNETLKFKAQLAKKEHMVEKTILMKLYSDVHDFKIVVLLLNLNYNIKKKSLKGKNVVENDVPLNNANVITPEMFRLDFEPLSPKLLKNRDAHTDYIKHNQEHADTLQEIVEHARALKSLDNILDSACKYAKRIQEVLVYVTTTCPSLTKPNENLVAVTPLDKNKKVRFVKSATSSRMKSSTSTSRSQPSGNTKKNKISQTTSSNEKNKVEDHPKSVKSSSNKKNHVSKHVYNANVKHSMLNANSELICVTCQKFTIDGNRHPLTSITSTNVMPPKNPLPTKVTKKTKPRRNNPEMLKDVTNISSISRSKVVQIVLWYLASGCSKHMTGNRSQLINFIDKFLGTVRFGNDQIAKIIGQFCDFDFEVYFRKHTYYIRDLEGVDLLKGSRGSNLYTLSLEDMMLSSPICLLSKASKTKSWLWHRCLSHLNFGTINQLAKQGLVTGLPKMKFKKDHLCYACSLGKRKKHYYKPKFEDTNQEKLCMLHMDLCGPIRVEGINEKKHILVIVDDYSRFTWVKFLRSKDEALEFIIKFLKTIQVHLNTTEILFQPLFDEYFNPPSSVASLVVAPEPVDLTGTPSSTSIDQDAPSPSTSQTPQESQSLVIPSNDKEQFHDIEVAHLDNDPFFGVLIPKPNFEESSSRDVIPTNVHSVNQPPEHLRK